MQINSGPLLLDSSHRLSLDTDITVKGKAEFSCHVDVDVKRLKKFKDRWEVVIILSGDHILDGAQQKTFKLKQLPITLLVGLFDSDYYRLQNRYFNIIDYLDDELLNSNIAREVGDKIICSIKKSQDQLLIQLGEGVNGILKDA